MKKSKAIIQLDINNFIAYQRKNQWNEAGISVVCHLLTLLLRHWDQHF